MSRPHRKMLLALPAPQNEEDKETVIAHGTCFLQRSIEPAGHAFHTMHEKPIIDSKRKGKKFETEARDGSDDDAADDSKWRKKHKGKEGGEKGKSKAQGSLKLCPELEGADLYALLEVSEGATEEQIKKQYRKLALQHHPDKVKSEGAVEGKSDEKDEKGLSEQDLLFIRIQGAYEVLADQTKRRQYDSTLEFDDSVPDEVGEGGFYATFLPVFHRNGRFSIKRPVPELGDEGTSLDKVHKFYDWWYNFESWRDFTQHAEHNLEDAEFREERRWMERQNQKILKKYEQEERRRLLQFVETVERLDPRIRAEREEKEAKKREEKERRARLKQEEEDAKSRAEEEKRRQEEQEKAEKEEQERLEREQRKEGKQVLKGLRQRLKKSLQAQGKCDFSPAEMEDLQVFALWFEEAEPLEALCARLEGKSSAKAVAAAVREELVEWRRKTTSQKEKEERQREEARRLDDQKAKEAKEAAAVAATGKDWSTEELGMLAKGLQKFPGGFGGRWAAISQFLGAAAYHRTEQEVIAKTKELSEGKSLKSMGSRLDSTFDSKKAKAAAAPKATPQASAAGDKPSPEKSATAETAEATAAVEWTSEQQQALETALQKFPATLDKNERWRLIAEAVPGKSKSQCVARFKYLREQAKG